VSFSISALMISVALGDLVSSSAFVPRGPSPEAGEHRCSPVQTKVTMPATEAAYSSD
jgi:hypothetical protein